MYRNYKFAATIAALAFASLACGINLTLPEDAIKVGSLVTDNILVQAPSPGETTDVLIEFGAGELYIQPDGSNALIQGTATYNIEDLKPQITTSGRDVHLDQGSFEYEFTGLPNFSDIENTWDLQFSSQPINLEVRAGAFKGDFEFGNMAIHELKIFGGASSLNLAFSRPNLVPMGQFKFTSGASNVELTGLANANFSLMNFQGGGGSYKLDFSGQLLRDATIEIDGGLSNFSLVVPQGIPAIVTVSSNLTNVSTSGTWTGSETTFMQAGEGPTLTFIIKLGAGQLTLGN